VFNGDRRLIMVMPIDQSFNNLVARQSAPDEPVYRLKQRAVDIPLLQALENAIHTAPEGSRETAIADYRQARDEMAAALAEERGISIVEAKARIEATMAMAQGGMP